MLNATEELMRLHPASHFGRLEHHPSDLEAFEELESRHLRPRQADRREPTWMIGEVAAAAAILIALVGVLTLFARLARWVGNRVTIGGCHFQRGRGSLIWVR